MIENVLEPVESDLVQNNFAGQIGRETQIAGPIKVKHTLKHLSVTVYEELLISAKLLLAMNLM
jgi:hypothetical protein